MSKDKNIRRRPLETEALMESNVKAFFLTAGDLRGEDQAGVFVRALPRIRHIFQGKGPFIARITASANVKIIVEAPRQRRRRRRAKG